MNVEIWAEAALFPEKEYISGILVAVQRVSEISTYNAVLVLPIHEYVDILFRLWPLHRVQCIPSVRQQHIHCHPQHTLLPFQCPSADYSEPHPDSFSSFLGRRAFALAAICFSPCPVLEVLNHLLGARKQVGIGLSYRPGTLQRLANFNSLESILGLLKSFKIRALHFSDMKCGTL
jgi:hypothetical protein